MEELLKLFQESERARRELEERQQKMEADHHEQLNSVKAVLQQTAKHEDVQRLKSKVDKIAPQHSDTSHDGHGLMQITQADTATIDEVRIGQHRVERHVVHLETHVGVVTDETQRLREEIEELKRQVATSTQVSQAGMYAAKNNDKSQKAKKTVITSTPGTSS